MAVAFRALLIITLEKVEETGGCAAVDACGILFAQHVLTGFAALLTARNAWVQCAPDFECLLLLGLSERGGEFSHVVCAALR
jgi:hypothetical protein